jgi:peptide deformylase
MILPIYLYGSGVLREKTLPVSPDCPGLKQLIDDMYETMYAAEGVGLAAPQTGVSIRMFVVDANELSDDEPSAKGFRQTFINPEILERSGARVMRSEGCLSLPNMKADVLRENTVKVRYFDEDFVEHTQVFDGIIARIIQHEYDHLEGILYPDHLSPLKKKLLKRKLDDIRLGTNKAHYRSKID